ncbi:secondary thiamine-phosphate synthase enzyme YjbQ [Alteromonas oceanisediminis]|uniref:secondary thiamine-phosphate synthase enzyme YjbQ n=1 Tax=Alteromonas oceanisediminis TaxID=2836180 RepID=UPI001BDB3369|nr:secondary thiamine-phosphate synthase enzyme YjbQ [Alteromonas oceanisediminis]MBT0586924.1 secondary thiamine-phosphate synthase enzyme YjbQ [Alteromonas oceanisediminis]
MECDSVRFCLPTFPRGFHLITEHVISAIPSIKHVQSGILQLSLLHTSASLCINENADPTVRTDLEAFCNELCSDSTPYFIHTYEGKDDMPAHVKSAIFGSSLSLSIDHGKLVLGTWQGIYLGEHRDNGGKRTIHATFLGKSMGKSA